MSIEQIGSTLIGLTKIPAGAPLQRRQRERTAVAMVLAQIAPECVLSHNSDGAPILASERGSLNISISHSQRLAAVAIDPQRTIGIDAEEWRPALDRVKTRFLTNGELGWVDTPEALLKAWTVKEAVYKAAGRRLLTSQEIEIAPNWEMAAADGCDYSLEYIKIGTTQVTLGVRMLK